MIYQQPFRDLDGIGLTGLFRTQLLRPRGSVGNTLVMAGWLQGRGCESFPEREPAVCFATTASPRSDLSSAMIIGE